MEIARRLGAEMAEMAEMVVSQMGEPEKKGAHVVLVVYTHTWRRLYFLVSWQQVAVEMWNVACVERTDQTKKRN